MVTQPSQRYKNLYDTLSHICHMEAKVRVVWLLRLMGMLT